MFQYIISFTYILLGYFSSRGSIIWFPALAEGQSYDFPGGNFEEYGKVNQMHSLTHWGPVTHICVGNLTIIGSDNGLSPGRQQAIIWTNAGILLIGPLGTNFSETLIKLVTFSFKKMRSNVSSGKWWPFCLGLNVLRTIIQPKQSNGQQIHEHISHNILYCKYSVRVECFVKHQRF